MEITPVWKQVTPELKDELLAFWKRHKAFGDPERAGRAEQAVCVARDEQGELCGVGTAFIQVLPRLQQPMYYYRQFFAESHRGQKQTVPFFNRVRETLQAYNASLPAPESIGVLVELQSDLLATYYNQAHIPLANSTFIGYSPGGSQLRVSYFEGAILLPRVARPVQVAAAEGRSQVRQQPDVSARRSAAQKD